MHGDTGTVDRGRAWLLANVREDGSWRSPRDPSGIRSSARAVQVLDALAPAGSRTWLGARATALLEETADAALALRQRTPPELLTPLNALSTGAGTWGAEPGGSPDPYHTALGLIAAAATDSLEATTAADAVAYLTAEAKEDGSWAAGETGQQTAVTTAVIARALLASALPEARAAIAAAKVWLLGHANADGGWGHDGSTPAVTAQVLQTLHWCGVPVEAETAAAAYLAGAQRADGSWEADPWTTALVLEALTPAGLPELVAAIGGVTPDPDPVAGDTWRLRVRIVNTGSVAATPAAARCLLVDGGGAEIARRDQTLGSLAPGAEEQFTFEFPTAGLEGSFTWRVSLDPDDLVSEGNEQNNHHEGLFSIGGWRNLAIVPGSPEILTSDGLLGLDPANLSVGVDVVLTADIAVEGTHGASDLEVYVFRGDPAHAVLAGLVTVPNLAPGATTRIVLPWRVEPPTGPGSLVFVVDPYGHATQTSREDDRAELPVVVRSQDEAPPDPPGGLTARLESRDRVVLSWWASPSPDVVGYRLYRDGVPVNATDLAPGATASAYDSYNLREYLPPPWDKIAAFDPPNMNDGDPDTSWWSIQFPFLEWDPEPCYVQFGLDHPRGVRGVIVEWFNFDLAGKDFRVQLWDGQQWVDRAVIEDNLMDRSVVVFTEPVVTEKVRVLIEQGVNEGFVAIREVHILSAGPGEVIAGTTFVDTALPGVPARYTVAAVDAAGNESLPSAPFLLEDRRPPRLAVTAPAAGSRVGPEILILGTVTDEFLQGYYLEWNRGSNPTEWIRVDQRAEPVVNGTLFVWKPPPDLDETCTFRVVAIDGGGIGNLREVRRTLWVDTTPPARPAGLISSLDVDKLLLTWTPNAEPDLAGYQVIVNGESEGLNDVASVGTASASASYADAFVDLAPGNANDGNPASVWRPPADSFPSWWRLDFDEPRPLQQVTFSWQSPFIPRRLRIETLDADGVWSTRWWSDDNTDEENIVDLGVASQVHALRVTILEGVILGGGGVHEPGQIVEPPAPYPVLAEVSALAAEILPTPEFSTSFSESREYWLTVDALDDVGNRSSPSQAAVVDLRGPRVAILTPKFADPPGRAVVISGYVQDRYLKDYVIEVGRIDAPGQEPAVWEEVHRSLGNVAWGEVMTVWYPTLVKGWHTIRLTARDQSDTATVARVNVEVDAMPPEPPANLAAVETGGRVVLTWDASELEADLAEPCADLAGYRVYRDNIPLSVRDVAFLARVTGTTLAPKGRPYYMVDGLHQSSWMPEPFSKQAEVFLDLPQPFTIDRFKIEWDRSDWLWGRDYRVDVWDAAEGAWRTVADVTGRIAPSGDHPFAATTTNRVRLTLLKGPTAYSLGSIKEIHLFQDAPVDLLAETTYTDELPVGGEAAYRVTAFDGRGNESTKSNRVRIDNAPPRVAIVEPKAGELHLPAGSRIAIRGTVDEPLLREYKVELGTGDPVTLWVTLAEQRGLLQPILTPAYLAGWTLPKGVEGPYTIRLSALDEGYRRSETSVAVFVDTKAPPVPEGLVAAAQAGGVRLDWSAVNDGGLAGYHVYRNGKRLDLADIAVNGEAKSSSFSCSACSCFGPELSNDGNGSSAWIGLPLQVPAWVRLFFDGFYPVTGVKIDWEPWHLARSFTVQGWDRANGSWVDLAGEEFLDANPYEHTFAGPVRMEGFRIHMTQLQNEVDFKFGIREIHLLRAPGAETPSAPLFFDDATGDLEYTYRVSAVDRFGNESSPSSEVQVDDRAPRVAVTSPRDGERVGAHVELEGKVEDWRLLDYRLEVGRGESPSSFSVVDTWVHPVENGVVAVWDPPPAEDAVWTLRLIARDYAENETVVERRVRVDTTPPPVPQNLAAQALGSVAVELSWDHAAAPDRAGYNVYRQGRLLNDASVTSWGVAGASAYQSNAALALDGLLDDKHTWITFGTPCWWKEDFPSAVTIDQVEVHWLNFMRVKPPRDYEFQVLDGADWKTVLMVWDNQYKHRFHAVAVPASSRGLRVLITEADRDLLGKPYSIGLSEIRFWDHARGRLVAENRFLDEGLSEIGWSYEVTAVDDRANESARSGRVMIDTAPPVVALTEPASGAVVSGPTKIIGSVRDTNLSVWRLDAGRGENPATWVELASGSLFADAATLTTWKPPPDEDAPYTLRLTATDHAGGRGEARAVVRVLTRPPSAPKDFAAAVGEDGAVVLTWGRPDYGDVAGYNVYRNGEKLNRTDLTPLATPSASSHNGCSDSAPLAVDGDLATYWVPVPFVHPAWIALDFPQTRRIQGVVLDWFETKEGDQYFGASYQIQARQGGEWKTLVFVENNKDQHRADNLPAPADTDGIRVLIADGTDEDFPGVVREVRVLSAESFDLLTEPTFTDWGLDEIEGVYTVTAVDSYGHESLYATLVLDELPPRIAITAPADGDRVPRSTVMKGTVKDLTLVEMELAYSRDGGGWEVLSRPATVLDSERIAAVNLPQSLSYEGPGTLRLTAYDQGGNVTEQLVPLIWDTVPPPAPAGLTAVALGNAGAALSWSPVPVEDLAGYFVRRAGQTLNPGNLIENAVASASDVYGDAENHQPWAAVDTIPTTSWWSGRHDGEKVLEVAFPQRRSVSNVTYAFEAHPLMPCMVPLDFRVEAVIDGAWRQIASAVNFDRMCGGGTFPVYLNPAILTDRIRLTATRGNGEPPFMIAVREVSVSGPGLVPVPQYTDSALSAVETYYDVVAQDRAGNQSQPSAPAYIDALPPRVALTAPQAGSVQPRKIPITGSTQDPNLQSWRLEWGAGAEPSSWTTLYERTNARYYPFTQHLWDALGAEGPVTIRLSAADATGSRAEARVVCTVDGKAPAAPTGLAAAVFAGGVNLTWNANSENDLAGYNIYRDGLLLTGGDVSRFGSAGASSAQPANPADRAIDDNSATAWRSNPAVAGLVSWQIDFRDPFTISGIEVDFESTPATGMVVEGSSGSGWEVLGSLHENMNPSRVIVFPATTVRSVRLRFPEAEQTNAAVALAEVRLLPAGPRGPVAALAFLDAALADPTSLEHRWALSAVDLAGNESPLSAEVALDTVAPRLSLSSPVEGARVGAVVTVVGSVSDDLLTSWKLTAEVPGSGTTTVAQGSAPVAGKQLGVWSPPGGIEQEAILKLSATDRAGVSALAERRVLVDTRPPGVPTNLAVVNDLDGLRLSWSAPGDADLAGYVVYRNGEPLQAPDLSRTGAVISQRFSSPEAGRDGSPTTSAWGGATATEAAWWGLQYRTPHRFTGLRADWTLLWGTTLRSPSAFKVQVFTDGQWMTVASFAGGSSEQAEYRFADEVTGEGLRIVIEGGVSCQFEDLAVLTNESGLLAATVYRDLVLEAWEPREAAYQVRAVDFVGNEGALSSEVVLDLQGPTVAIAAPLADALVAARVPVTGTARDALLATWSLQASLGGGAWQSVAEGTQAVDGGALALWQPPAGFVGSGRLKLTAQDRAGNAEAVEVPLRVDADPPAAPRGLVAELTENGVDLAWVPNGEADLAGYRIFRGGIPLTGDIAAGAVVKNLAGQPLSGVADANPATYAYVGGSPLGADISFDYRVEISSVELEFTSSSPVPGALTLQSWTGGGWLTLARVAGNTSSKVVLSTVAPVAGSRFRVLLQSGASYVYLSNVRVQRAGADPLQGTACALPGLDAREDAFTVVAVDTAGNQSAPSVPAIIDRVPPVAKITSPVAGTFVTSAINVMGTASDPLLDSWTLAWSSDADPAGWQSIGQGAGPVLGGVLGTFSPPAAEFAAILRLEVRDKAGNLSSDSVRILQDTVAPRVELNVSSRYWPPSDATTVNGRTEDGNLASARLTYLPAGIPGGVPALLDTWSESRSGALSTFPTADWPEGVGTLRLEATDARGQTASAQVKIDIAQVLYRGEFSPQSEQGPLTPMAASVSSAGLWVLDLNSYRAFLLSPEGDVVRQVPNESQSSLGYSTDIVAAENRIWIANGNLRAFTLDGYPIPGDIALANGYFLARLPDGQVGVLAQDNSSGTAQKKIFIYGPTGAAAGSVLVPSTTREFDADRYGYLYVLDESGKVSVMDRSGRAYYTINSPFSARPTNWWHGISVSPSGMIALNSASEGEKVAVLAPDGRLLTRFGLNGTGLQELDSVSETAFVGEDLKVLLGLSHRIATFTPILPGQQPEAPTAWIEHPEDGAWVSGGCPIVGTTWHEPSTGWVAEYGQGPAPSSWTRIREGVWSERYGSLGIWDTTGIADGVWTVRLTVNGATGPAVEQRVTVHVDNHKPSAQIVAPGAGQVLSGLAEVRGTASDEEFSEYVLTATRIGDSAGQEVTRGQAPVVNGTLGTWNVVSVPNGMYLLRLVVRDKSGNETSAEVSVAVGGVAYLGDLDKGLLMQADSVARLKDGRWLVGSYSSRKLYMLDGTTGTILKTLTQDFRNTPLGATAVAVMPGDRFAVINEYSQVRKATVFDAGGNALYDFAETGDAPGQISYGTITSIAADGQGRAFIPQRKIDFDENRRGFLVYDGEGRYQTSVLGGGDDPGVFRAPMSVATDAAGNIYVLDSENPRIQVFDPGGRFLEVFPLSVYGINAGSYGYSGLVALAVDPQGYMLVLSNETQKQQNLRLISPAGKLVAAWGSIGTAPGMLQSPRAAWMGDGLVAVADQKINGLVLYGVGALFGHPVGPVASIARPLAETLVPARMRILGTASGPGLTGYRLEIGSGRNPEAWIVAASGSSPVVDGVLGTVDFTQLPEGEISIRLTVETAEGGASAMAVCTLDKTPPLVEIASPAPYGLLRDNELVTYSVSDERLQEYSVKMGRDDKPSERRTLAQGSLSVSGSAASWQTTDFPPGVYQLALNAADAAGNRTRLTRYVSTGKLRLADIIPIMTAPNEGVSQPWAADGDGYVARGWVSGGNYWTMFIDPGGRVTRGWSVYDNYYRLCSDIAAYGNQVACLYYNNIRVYDRSGAILRTMGGSPVLTDPTSMTIDSQGRILVNDAYKTKAFTLDGQYLGIVGNVTAGWTASPGSDAFGNVYQVARQAPYVGIDHLPGPSLHAFGEQGTGFDRFSNPSQIATSPYGHVMVYDGSFKFFTPDGRFLGYMRSGGNALGWNLSGTMTTHRVWRSNGLISMLSGNRILVFDTKALFGTAPSPTASFAFPTEGAWVPSVFFAVGTALGEGSYTLEVEQSGSRRLIREGRAEVADGVLGVIEGAEIPEGSFDLVLTVDGTSDPVVSRRTVRRDVATPLVAIDAPQAYAHLRVPTPVRGRVQDAEAATWKLELSPDNLSWSLVATGSGAKDGELTVLDPSRWTAGFYFMRLTGWDRAGNSSSSQIIVSLGPVAFLKEITTRPGEPGYTTWAQGLLALPDGTMLTVDDSKDKVLHLDAEGRYIGDFAWTPCALNPYSIRIYPAPGGFTAVVRGSSDQCVQIVEADGRNRASFQLRSGTGSGVVETYVNVLTLEDRVLFPERQEVEVFAYDGTHLGTWGEAGTDPGEFGQVGSAVLQPQGRVLLSDKGNRLISYSTDGTYRGETVGVSFGSSVAVDLHGNIAVAGGYYVSLYRADGTYGGYFRTDGSGPGVIDARVLAFDANGTLWVQSYDSKRAAYSIDWDAYSGNLPPVALIAPVEGDFIAAEGWVTGRVSGVGPLSWSLSAGMGTDPTSWWSIAAGDRPMPPGILGHWLAGDRPDGPYTLRLQVVDGTGATSELRRTFILDATAPEVAVEQPADRALLRNEQTPISGTIHDENPLRYAVKYLAGDRTWASIRRANGLPAGSDLGTFYGEFLGPNVYRLKTWAIDRAMNLTHSNRDVSIHPLELLAEARVGWPINYSPKVGIAAARDGRLAVADPRQPGIAIYDSSLRLVQTLVPPAAAGWQRVIVEQMGFADSGELVAAVRNAKADNENGPQQLLRWSPSGNLSDILNVGVPNYWKMVVVNRDEIIVSYMYSSTQTKRISFIDGSSVDLSLSGTGLSSAPSLAAYPGGRVVLLGQDAFGKQHVWIVDRAGNPLSEILPPAGWRSSNYGSIAADGAGSIYLTNMYAATGYCEKYAADGTYLWSFGGIGLYPGRTYSTQDVPVYPSVGGNLYLFDSTTVRVSSLRALDDHVDAQPPVTSLNPALAQAALRGEVGLDGTVDDPHLVSWSLRAFPDGSEEGALILGQGTSPVVDSLFAIWNTSGKDGNWKLVLESLDSSGNRGHAELDVVVVNLPAPHLDPVPAAVCTTSLAVSGQGLAGNSAHLSLNGTEVATAPIAGDGTFSAAVGPLVEGANQITARIGDGNGHFGPSSDPLTVVADFAAPVTAIAVGMPQTTGDALYVTTATLFTLAVSDVGTGAARTEYRIDGGIWTAYAPFSVGVDGGHLVEYRSIDHAGNVEATKGLAVVVDTTAPSTTITVGAPKFSGSVLFVSGATVFTLEASDPGSGVTATQYRVDGGAWTPYAPFTLSGEGAHLIDYRSTDVLGNAEAVASLGVVVDTTPPEETSVSCDGPTLQDGAIYVAAATTLGHAALDSGSGIGAIEYRIDAGEWRIYQGRYHLSGDGPHVIGYRSRDRVGNLAAENQFEVVLDTAPPVATVAPGDPKHQGATLFVTEGTPIALAASDAGSGVASTEYQVDGNAWAAYEAAITISGEGAHTLGYRATDRLGNQGGVQSIAITVDTTPPATAAIVGEPQYSGAALFVTAVTPITLTASDTGSGVASTEYQVDGGAWLAYNVPITVSGEGAHTIGHRATDRLGNQSAAQSIAISVDTSPPAVVATVGEPRSQGEALFVAEATPITLAASDFGSGVASTEYQLDGGGWLAYDAPITVAGEGAHTIACRATDRLGNQSAAQLIVVTVDISPPTTAATVGDPMCQGDVLFVTEATSITLTANDAGSGVASTEYQLDGGAWRAYDVPITVSGEGAHTVGHRATDRLGNRSAAQSIAITVDTTPPATAATVGEPRSQAEALFVTEATPITLTASDTGSGVASIEYQLDGGSWLAYDVPITVSAEGAHTIGHRATDRLGNRGTTQSIAISIDTTPPTATVTVGEPKYQGAALFVTATTPITLTASDVASGVGATEYQVDGGAWAAYGGPITISGEGAHTVGYHATDRLGNQSTAAPLAVTVDTTGPDATLTVGSPQHQGTALFVRGTTPMTLGVSDSGAGLAGSTCVINPGAISLSYSAPFSLTDAGVLADGVHTITCTSTDRVGNAATAPPLTVKRDDTPPAVEAGDDVNVFARVDGTQSVTAAGTVFDGAGYDPAPAITWAEGATALGSGIDLAAMFSLGNHDLTLTAVDHVGNIATDTMRTRIMQRQVDLVYTGATTGQWSDNALLQVLVKDVTGGQNPIPLSNKGRVTFRVLMGAVEKYSYVVAQGTDANGYAWATHPFIDPGMPAGSYVIRTEFEDPAGLYAFASCDTAFTLAAEYGALDNTGDRLIKTTATQFVLKAEFTQPTGETNGQLVDFDNSANSVYARFKIYQFSQTPGPGVTPYYTSAPVRIGNSTPPGTGLGTLVLPISVVGDSPARYLVVTELTATDFALAYPKETTLTVYDDSAKRHFSGAGHVIDPGYAWSDQFAFGLTVENGVPYGSLVYSFTDESQSRLYRFRSSSIDDYDFDKNPDTVTTSGHGTLGIYDLWTGNLISVVANMTYELAGEDLSNSEVDGDTFQIEIKKSNGTVFNPGSMALKALLRSGNVVVHKN